MSTVEAAHPTQEDFAWRHLLGLSSNPSPCLRRLTGRRCLEGSPGGPCDGCRHFGYMDHARVWTRDKGRVVCITTEPYQLHHDDLVALVADCDRFDIDVTIHGGSWHATGSTCMIELWAKGERR